MDKEISCVGAWLAVCNGRWSTRCMTCLQQQDAKDIKESDEVFGGPGHLEKLISHLDLDPNFLAKISEWLSQVRCWELKDMPS